ncbi:dephospho-CoA kinase [Pelosinus propionicus]|uniref:Dephospho-CoA kinase n=1 Tax=Pelosinus propionicus DSM 13327 TaxID=1123291 RepID=A0A1I4MW51_9FIRM|nr:dephospho-CoA kinase [Pelosinus propionicus]SFM07542.1 dephospho-CoA kinase [Pelosinus propionicus DSM 13327]
MYVIGLTGGIASGKSTVSSMLAKLGAYIIDTDKIAREVVMPKQPALLSIVAHFGNAIMLPDGNVDRKMLGNIIFQNPQERSCLEKMIHPYIEAEVNTCIKKAEQLGHKAVVIDVPLLFEAGWQSKVDEIWVVYVDPSVQLSRLISRNQLTNKEAMDRINSQLNITEKAKQSHLIIDNTLDIENTKHQVITAWQSICEKMNKIKV